MEIILNILYVLIFPGILFVAVIGLLLAGIDRKVLARMQKRVGPPVIQPFYDFFKLLGKETIIPHAANKTAYLAAPVIGFVSLVVMMLFIPIFGFSAFSGKADLITEVMCFNRPGKTFNNFIRAFKMARTAYADLNF